MNLIEEMQTTPPKSKLDWFGDLEYIGIDLFVYNSLKGIERLLRVLPLSFEVRRDSGLLWGEELRVWIKDNMDSFPTCSRGCPRPHYTFWSSKVMEFWRKEFKALRSELGVDSVDLEIPVLRRPQGKVVSNEK